MKKLFETISKIKEMVDKYIDKKIIEEYEIYDLIEKSKTEYDYKKYLNVE